ncbi:hypothetical protein T459_22202 [Capsicum annuum]|uniref:MIT domain-containing protein n=1 Tax=Capsicum annuum TaxID=4072 RepID=A0A2G2YZ90_CAPAN|nr:hypothetical protein T459_22202 [Capsicum annuum]
MYSDFKAQAIEYVKQAIEEDKAGNHARAFPLYMNALEYFKTHLKYEKNPKMKEAITLKFTEYLNRAEEIRAVLDKGVTGPGPHGGGTSDSENRSIKVDIKTRKQKPANNTAMMHGRAAIAATSIATTPLITTGKTHDVGDCWNGNWGYGSGGGGGGGCEWRGGGC